MKMRCSARKRARHQKGLARIAAAERSGRAGATRDDGEGMRGVAVQRLAEVALAKVARWAKVPVRSNLGLKSFRDEACEAF